MFLSCRSGWLFLLFAWLNSVEGVLGFHSRAGLFLSTVVIFIAKNVVQRSLMNDRCVVENLLQDGSENSSHQRKTKLFVNTNPMRRLASSSAELVVQMLILDPFPRTLQTIPQTFSMSSPNCSPTIAIRISSQMVSMISRVRPRSMVMSQRPPFTFCGTSHIGWILSRKTL